MADFDIVVGARDEATRILEGVRVQANMLGDAITTLRQKSTEETSRIEIAFGALAGGVGAVAGLFALVSSARAFGDVGAKGLSEFASQLERINKAETFEAKLEIESNLVGTLEALQEYDIAVKRSEAASNEAFASIGALLAPLEILRLEGVEMVANAITTGLAPAIDFASSAMDAYRAVVEATVDISSKALVAGFTAVQVSFNEVATIAEASSLSVQLAFEMMKNDAMHVFGEVIPAYANWFVSNFPELISDGLGAAVVAVKNFATNTSEILQVLFEFVASGGSVGFDVLAGAIADIANKSLLEGFEATADKLPDVLGRKLTDKETLLAKQIKGLSGRLANDFNEQFAANMEAFDALLNNRRNRLGQEQEPEKERAKRDPSEILKAVESRLLVRGQTEGPLDALLIEAKQQNKFAEKQLEKLDQSIQLLRDRQDALEVEFIA